MTPDRLDPTPDESADSAEHAVLGEAGNLDTSGVGILGSTFTAQVPVSLSTGPDDEVDDDIVDDGMPFDDLAAMTAADAYVPRTDDRTTDDRADDVEVEAVVEDVVAGEYVEPEGTENVETAEVVVDAEPVHADADDVGDPSTGDADPKALESPTDAASADAAESFDAAASGRGSTRTTRVALPASDASPPAAAVSVPTASGSVPATRREAHHTGSLDRAHDMERIHPPQPEIALTSKRLGEFEGTRESSDLLTADRLLDHKQVGGPEPEGRWQHFLYSISGHRINLGDSKRVRARKELDRRIAAPLTGGARFVPVLSRKGGVGKTTITTLLGMALADGRDDRIIAIDANPDRGTLAERLARPSGKTVRDLARSRGEVNGYNDVSTVVTRDETRLDVLASDSDPRVSEAFSDRDYNDVASLASHYYSIVLTDTGTGIVHSVMGATLGLADQLVVVAGLSVDEARLASETLTWLETNGFADQVRDTVVVLNNARPGSPLVRQSELEAHFRSRVRTVVRMPYDPQIGTGSAISFRDLQPRTRQAARDLAAAVVEGLRGLPAAV